jgi:hypothetical protein
MECIDDNENAGPAAKSMAGQLLPGGSLAGGGWELSDEVGGYVGEGKVVDDQPQWSKGNGDAFFKHSQALAAGDVWRLKVVDGGGGCVGIAGAAYDPKRHMLAFAVPSDSFNHALIANFQLNLVNTNILYTCSRNGGNGSLIKPRGYYYSNISY